MICVADCHDGNNGWSYKNGQLTWRDKWCMDVPNGDATNGKPLQIWSCDANNDNQKWTTQS
jgi:hypothetical protein